MKALGVVVDKVELKKMITDVDADGSGSVEFPEFLQMMTAKMGSSDSKEDVVKVFKMFDENGTGKIDFKALRKVAKELGENLSDDELQVRSHAQSAAVRRCVGRGESVPAFACMCLLFSCCSPPSRPSAC